MVWNFEDAVEAIDSVPEDYRPAYAVNAEGKFALKPEFKPWATAVVGNVTSLASARKDLAKANKESADRRGVINAFEGLIQASGLTVEEGKQAHETLAAHIADLVAKSKNGGELKVNLDALRLDFAKQAKAIKDEAEGKLGKMTKTLQKHLIGDVAKSALAKAEGNETLLMPAIRDRVMVVEDGDDYAVRVVDAERNPRIDAKTGSFMTINALVEELKTNADYAMAFKSTTKSGNDSRTQTRPGAVRVTPNASEMTPVNKIAAGLKKGQFERAGTRQ